MLVQPVENAPILELLLNNGMTLFCQATWNYNPPEALKSDCMWDAHAVIEQNPDSDTLVIVLVNPCIFQQIEKDKIGIRFKNRITENSFSYIPYNTITQATEVKSAKLIRAYLDAVRNEIKALERENGGIILPDNKIVPM